MAEPSTSVRGEANCDLVRLIDVGSAGGLEPKWHPFADRLLPGPFEPNPVAAAALRLANPAALIVEAALFCNNERRVLHVTRNPLCISLLPPNDDILRRYDIAPHFEKVGEVEIQCNRYDTLHRRGLVPDPDVIKIDVQGCEFEALLGFGELLENCLGIELEAHVYPLYHGQRLLHDLVGLLDRFGMTLRTVRPSPQFDGDLVEVDAFFTRSRRAARDLDPVRRRKFDLLHDVWQLPAYAA